MKPADAEAALRAARESHGHLAPFTDTHPHLDEAWGYTVQGLDRAHRLASGERVVGAKLGLTSRAKQTRMNVDQPVVGFLTDAMQVHPGRGAMDPRRWARPRIEPEIAFITATDLAEPVDLDRAHAAVESVAVAAEVIDSRFADFRFRLPDVLADNTSAAGFVVGPPRHLDGPDALVSLDCHLDVDDRIVHRATGAAILGHPLRALVRLSEHLARQGAILPAGSVVLAGALTDAVPLTPRSRYTIRMGPLGELTLEA